MTFKLNNVHKAVNWNVEDDDFTQAFWDQNVKQFWLPEEISVSKDVKVWSELSPEERNLYKKVLGGLTLLDTKQANNGIPSMMSLTDNLQRKPYFHLWELWKKYTQRAIHQYLQHY